MMKDNRSSAQYILLLTCCILIFTGFYTKKAHCASTYQFQLTDLNGTAKTTFSQGDIVRYNLSFDFNFPTFILSILNVKYQGAETDTPPNKINLFLPGISPDLRETNFRSLDSSGFFGFFSQDVYWQLSVPKTAWDTTEVTLRMLSIPGKLNIIKREFTVSNNDPDSDNSSSQICSACHQDLYYGWRSSNHYPAVGCESCHGSGEDHLLNPSAETIKTPDSATFCNVCHSKNNGSAVEAEDGFIRHMQQNNEIASIGHKRLDCLTCHNPHYGPSAGSNFGIKRSCSSCHSDKSVYLNMQQLECIDCHMPYAVKNISSSGFGNYKEGDVRTHLVRIRGSDDPDRMFSTTGSKLALDETGKPFVNLSFACLTCHNGSDAVFQDYSSMQQTHTLIH